MKKITVTCILILLLLALTAQAQDIKFKDNYDITGITRVGEIVKKFHEPPEAFYQYVPNGIIIKLKDNLKETKLVTDINTFNTGIPEIDALNKKFEVKKFQREFPDLGLRSRIDTRDAIDLKRYYVVEFSEKFRAKEVLEAYRAVTEVVEHGELIGVHPIYESIPNDPYFLSDQWNFYNPGGPDIDATFVWMYETGSTSVILAVLDSGVQYNSRDLGGTSPYTNGNVWINWDEYNGMSGIDDDGNGFVDDWIGWDFVNGATPCYTGEDCNTQDNEPTDFNGHGTHVSGIIGAITNNGVMVAGLAGGWGGSPANGIKVMPVRIGWSAPHPVYGEVGYVRMDFAAQGIYYAVNNGATAINCSWGSSNSGGIAAAVDYATAHNVLVVAAAGNDGSSSPDYLGSRTDVVNVCATDNQDHKASFSNYGTWVDMAAPGVNILSTYSLHYNANYIAWLDGTSQAAPHVVGAAGILKSFADTLTRDQIVDLLQTYADDIDKLNPSYSGLMGAGRLNVFRSFDGIEAPKVTVVQPNGGEVLYIGQVYTIMWDATDNVDIVSTTIDYSVNSGVDWTHVVDLPGNPGEYDWTVTGPPSDQCRMRVTCYDAVDLAGDDMSDEDFCPPYKMAMKTFAILGSGPLPEKFALHQNYPNPFNPTTEIKFSLVQAGDVTLDIYNSLGQKVMNLVDGSFEAGTHSVTWNGTSDNGKKVASGLYFYKITAGDNVATKKMLLLK